MTEKKAAYVTTNPVQTFGTFTNAIGEQYTIHGLSPVTPQRIMESVRAEFLRAGKPVLAVPTYKVQTATGEEEIHEHDATTLVVPDNPAQTQINQDAWQEYVKSTAALDAEYNVRLMRVVFLAVTAKPTQEWRDEMAFTGVDLPAENSPAERYLYVETRVIQSAKDVASLMTGVFRLAGVISEAAVAEVDATFQRAMEEAVVEAGVKAD